VLWEDGDRLRVAAGDRSSGRGEELEGGRTPAGEAGLSSYRIRIHSALQFSLHRSQTYDWITERFNFVFPLFTQVWSRPSKKSIQFGYIAEITDRGEKGKKHPKMRAEGIETPLRIATMHSCICLP
jgi:hypothetical protein